MTPFLSTQLTTASKTPDGTEQLEVGVGKTGSHFDRKAHIQNQQICLSKLMKQIEQLQQEDTRERVKRSLPSAEDRVLSLEALQQKLQQTQQNIECLDRSGNSTLERQPRSIVTQILSFLPAKEQCRVITTCQSLNRSSLFLPSIMLSSEQILSLPDHPLFEHTLRLHLLLPPLEPQSLLIHTKIKALFHRLSQLILEQKQRVGIHPLPFFPKDHSLPESPLEELLTPAKPQRLSLQLPPHSTAADLKVLLEAYHPLTGLDLSRTQIEPEGLETIAHTGSGLLSLCLPRLAANNQGVELISQPCPKLRYLDLSRATSLPLDGLHKLAQGPSHLLGLNLSDLRVNDQQVQWLIQQFPQLTHLEMRYPMISELGLEALALGLPHLAYLDLTGLKEITPRGVAALDQLALHLTHLNLAKADLSDELLERLAQTSKPWTHLDLSRCTLLSSSSLEIVLRKCPKLKHLKLIGCQTSPQLIHTLAQSCPDLASLAITADQLNAGAISALIQGCPQLRQVAFAHLDKNLIDALNHPKGAPLLLSDITLFHVAIDDDQLEALVKRSPQLRSIELSLCNKVSNARVEQLRSSYPKLQIEL